MSASVWLRWRKTCRRVLQVLYPFIFTVEENTYLKSLAGLSDNRLLQKTVDGENESGVNTLEENDRRVCQVLWPFHVYRRGEHLSQIDPFMFTVEENTYLKSLAGLPEEDATLIRDGFKGSLVAPTPTPPILL